MITAEQMDGVNTTNRESLKGEGNIIKQRVDGLSQQQPQRHGHEVAEQPQERHSGSLLADVGANEWTTLPRAMLVDPRAVQTVLLLGCLVHRTKNSVQGKHNPDRYTAANSAPIFNEGEKTLLLSTLNGEHGTTRHSSWPKPSRGIQSSVQRQRQLRRADATALVLTFLVEKKNLSGKVIALQHSSFALCLRRFPQLSRQSDSVSVQRDLRRTCLRGGERLFVEATK